MKLAIVEAMFPELRGGSIYKTARGKGATKRVAIARAMSALLKEVPGKRISVIKATITLSDVPETISSVVPVPERRSDRVAARNPDARLQPRASMYRQHPTIKRERCTCENNGDLCAACEAREVAREA